MSRWQWLFLQAARQLWVKASLIGLLGVAAALLALVVEKWIPWQLPDTIGADAVDSLLNIIASSMLAVTTFSLSVVTSAYGSAANGVTPRATRLVMEDRTTQNVLSTFIGSFLFAIVGIIVLRTGAYGDRGRFVLFIVTVAVIVLIVFALLRWIDHLTKLGRVGETTDRVEQAARIAIEDRLAMPFLGGVPFVDGVQGVPQTASAIESEQIGYVQHVDIAELNDLAERVSGSIYLLAVPGTFVYPKTALAHLVVGRLGEERQEDILAEIAEAFTIGNERSFEQDPRFGLAVMSEIGSRALSPATNDPGTALDVIGRLTRLLCIWAQGSQNDEVKYPLVYVKALDSDDLFEDAFMLIARDGAGLVEIQLRLQKALNALSKIGDDAFRAAAQRQAQLARKRAVQALSLEDDRERLGSAQ